MRESEKDIERERRESEGGRIQMIMLQKHFYVFISSVNSRMDTKVKSRVDI